MLWTLGSLDRQGNPKIWQCPQHWIQEDANIQNWGRTEQCNCRSSLWRVIKSKCRFYIGAKCAPLTDVTLTALIRIITDACIIIWFDVSQEATLKNLCKSCGVEASGSRIDLIIRLREKLQDQQTYVNVYKSVWGESGTYALNVWLNISKSQIIY